MDLPLVLPLTHTFICFLLCKRTVTMYTKNYEAERAIRLLCSKIVWILVRPVLKTARIVDYRVNGISTNEGANFIRSLVSRIVRLFTPSLVRKPNLINQLSRSRWFANVVDILGGKVEIKFWTFSFSSHPMLVDVDRSQVRIVQQLVGLDVYRTLSSPLGAQRPLRIYQSPERWSWKTRLSKVIK